MFPGWFRVFGDVLADPLDGLFVAGDVAFELFGLKRFEPMFEIGSRRVTHLDEMVS